MTIVVGIISALAFAVVATAHLLTFVPIDPSTFLPMDLLFVGAIPVMGLTVFTGIWRQQTTAGGAEESRRQWQAIWTRLPRWAVKGLTALFCYAILNFIFVAVNLGNVQPRDYGDRYVLVIKHGSDAEIRPVSESEYRRYHACEIRGMTGHLMVFYWVFALISWGMATTPAKSPVSQGCGPVQSGRDEPT